MKLLPGLVLAGFCCGSLLSAMPTSSASKSNVEEAPSFLPPYDDSFFERNDKSSIRAYRRLNDQDFLEQVQDGIMAVHSLMRRLESMVVFGGDKTRDVMRTVCNNQSILLSSYCQMISETSMPLWSQIESTLRTGITRAVDSLATAAARLTAANNEQNRKLYDKAQTRAEEALAEILTEITEKLPKYDDFGEKFNAQFNAIQNAKTELDKLSGEEKRRLIKEFSEGPKGHVTLSTRYTNGVFHPFLDVWNNAGPVLSARKLSEAEREYEKHFCLFVAVSFCKIHPLGGGAKEYVVDFDSKVITNELGKFICEVDAEDLEISDQMIYGIEEWGKVLQGGQNLQMATGDIKLLLKTMKKKLSDMRLDLEKERQEVALLSEKTSDLYQNLTRKEDEINLATRTIGELRAQLIDLQGVVEEQTDNYQTLKNRLDALSQEKFNLEGTIRRLERELEDTRVSKESKIEILERLNNSMRETIGKQTIEMNTLQVSERKLSVDLKTIDAVNARLSRSLEEANNAIARMDTERKANNVKIKKTEQENKTLQNQVDLLKDQMEVLKAKISQAQAMNIDLQKNANENKEKFGEAEERMRVEIAMLKGSVESLRKERDTQAREITNLRNIISEMSIVGKAVIEGGAKSENVIPFNADDKKGGKSDED